jgi:SiaC family regulatory phosphoprotein
MLNLSIEASENSPEVIIDSSYGVLEIKGNSTLSAAEAFYKQLARWIHAFNLNNPSTRTVNIKFERIDMKSFQSLLFLLHELEQINRAKNNKLIINWYYTLKDEQILNLGKMYKTIIQLPFNLVAA